MNLRTGARIDGFVLGALLGAGGMGEVWSARDERLGRRVALKFPRTAGDGRAVERFLEEARLTARVAHPNVVTVFAAGEWGGRPWLAMELLDGVSLRSRLDRPLAVPEAVRVALDVARGVAAGHAAGIVHGDLKPENVVLPADGRVRVVDFGLARLLGDASGTRGGTPEYLAPEVWRGEAPSPASDVWALGILLRELFCGGRPGPEGPPSAQRAWATADAPVPPPPNAATLPDDLAALLTATLDRRPEERPTAAALAEALSRRLQRGERREVVDSPFRGLLPYTEADAGWFFGRDRELAALVERLRLAPFLPVVGASGAGKSSFVLAGALPRLREQGALAVVTLRPGPAPLRALAQALRGAASSTWRGTETDGGAARSTLDSWSELTDVPDDEPAPTVGDDLEARLRQRPGTLQAHLLALAGTARCLLIVDQLEEVFTQGAAEDEVSAFLTAVLGAGDAAALPIRVLVTLRDDFLGRLAQALPAALVPREVFVLRPPDAPVLVAALSEALEAAGARTDDPELMAELVASVAGSPAALPLAQFAARQLWERRDVGAGVLRRADWEAMGGARGALAGHADDVLGSLSVGQRAVARELLLRFVTAQGTRRTVEEGEVTALTGGGPEGAAVLERLSAGRLVTSGRAGDRILWELAHDSLVTSWPQLARWRAEAGEGARVAQELEAAAALWDQRGRRPTELWGDEALRDAEPRLAGTRATPLAEAFLQGSRGARDSRERLRRWTLRGAVAAVSALFALSVLGAGAWRRRAEVAVAASERAVAEEAEALAAAAQSAWDRGERPQARALLRTAARLGNPGAGATLWWQMQRAPVLDTFHLSSPVWSADVSPDGTELVVAGDAAEVRILDLATHAVVSTIALPEPPDAVGFAADGRVLAAWSSGAAWIEDGLARETPGPDATLLSLRRVGERLVGIGLDEQERGRVSIWDPDGALRNLTGPPRHLSGAAAPDGRSLATFGLRGGSLWVWDLDAGIAREVAAETDRSTSRIGWSADGRTLVELGAVARYHGLDGGGVRTGAGVEGPVAIVVDTPDGWRALTMSGVWYAWRDGQDPTAYAALRLPDGRAPADLPGAVVSGANAVVAADHQVWVVGLDRGAEGGARPGAVTALAATPGGVWAGWAGGGLAKRRLTSEGVVGDRVLASRPVRINAVAGTPAGDGVLAGGNEPLALLATVDDRLRSLASAGDVVGVGFVSERPWVAGLAGVVGVGGAAGDPGFSVDLGKVVYHAALGPRGLALAQEDGGVRVVGLRPGGREVARWAGHELQANRVAWLDDGRLASAGFDGRVVVHAPGSDDVSLDHEAADETPLATLPGGRVVWVHADGTLRAGRPGEPAAAWFTPFTPTALATSPDGRWLWVGDAAGEVRALEVASGRIPGHRPAPAEPRVEGRAAAPAAGGWCALGWDRILRWAPAPDGPPAWEEPDVESAGAVGDACVGLRGGSAWRRGAHDDPPTPIAADVASVAWGDGVAWLVGAGRSLLVHGGGSFRLDAELPATAVSFDGAEVLLGRDDGTLAAWRPDAEPALESGLLELPDAPIVAVASRSGWLALGFADGQYGLWVRATGRRVAGGALRGRVIAARLDADVATFATDMGDRSALDVAALLAPGCAWRSEVEATVPDVWREGRVVPAAAGPDPCR